MQSSGETAVTYLASAQLKYDSQYTPVNKSPRQNNKTLGKVLTLKKGGGGDQLKINTDEKAEVMNENIDESENNSPHTLYLQPVK